MAARTAEAVVFATARMRGLVRKEILMDEILVRICCRNRQQTSRLVAFGPLVVTILGVQGLHGRDPCHGFLVRDRRRERPTCDNAYA